MSLIDWELYTERAVGRGSPTYADVANRPLREVLTASGYDPDQDFAGFAKTTHTHAAGDIASGTLSASRGGTGLSAPTAGGLLVAAGIAVMTLLAPGANGQVVKSTGTAWASAAIVSADISDAASANTPSVVVKRDGLGNFVAGTITAALAGNASTASALATPRAINGVAFDGSAPITVKATATNALTIGAHLTGGSYDGSAPITIATDATSLNTLSTIVARDGSGNFAAGTITASLTGNVTGNASTATALSSVRTFALTSDVTGSASSDLSGGVSITVTLGAGVVADANVKANAAIAYSKLALAASIVNADISGSANIADAKLAQLTTPGKVANSATTATASNTVSTIVARDASGNFAAGAITATSVAGDGSALTSLNATQVLSGTLPAARLAGAYTGITQVGTLTAGVWNATVIGPTFGGTGQNAVAIGDLLYGSAANTWARLVGNATTTRKFLLQTGDGVNPTAPSWATFTAADVGAGTFTGAFTFAGALGVNGGVTATLGTLNGASTPAFSSTATWNNATTVFVHQFANITDTTSNAGSLLAQWQVGGVDQFKVSKAGVVTASSFVGSVAGNATTATALQTARAINGVNFDGTAAITVTAAAGTLTGTSLAAGVVASSLTSVGTLTSLTVSGATSLQAAGDVLVIGGNANTTTTVVVNAASSTAAAYIKYQSAGNNRWGVGRGPTAASDNFEFFNYGRSASDLTISNASGMVTAALGLTVSANGIAVNGGTSTFQAATFAGAISAQPISATIASTVDVSGNAVTIANNGVFDFPAGFSYGMLVIEESGSSGCIGVFACTAASAAVKMADTVGKFSVTQGTASAANLYYATGAWHLENKLGSSLTFRIFGLKTG